MKKLWIGILIVVLYCFPVVFFGMYQDFVYHSMMGYVLMLLATIILAYIGQYFVNSIPLIIGNILSTIVSIYFNNVMSHTPRWDVSYFTPFTPLSLLITVSIVNLIPQAIGVLIAIIKTSSNLPRR